MTSGRSSSWAEARGFTAFSLGAIILDLIVLKYDAMVVNRKFQER